MIDETEAYALLWEGRKVATRGPKRAMSVSRIAEVAVRIADTEGIAAVTLEGVAQEFGFTKMALYRYVGGKDELVAVMVEAAVGTPPDLSKVEGWRDRVVRFAEALGREWHTHPWLPWVSTGERAMGPAELSWVECAVSAFDDTPLDSRERLDAAYLLFGHMRNSQSMSRAGTQPWLPDRRVRPALRKALVAHAARYPALATAIESLPVEAPHDNGRELGLQVILDGLATRIDGR